MKQIIVLESRGQGGGACESTKLLLKEIGYKVDLMIPKDEEGYLTKRDVKKFYGKYIGDVYEFYLPYSLQNTVACEVYNPEDMKRKYRMFVQNKKEIYDFFERESYDNIHLNGIGLYPMLTKRFPMTLHMRQVFNGGMYQKLKRMHYLKKSQAIIYIDESTKKPFLSLKNRNIVLANPVDQTGVNSEKNELYIREFSLNKEDVIFVMSGTLSEGKGTEFVIKAFNAFNSSAKYQYKLLLIGGGCPEFIKKCRELAKENSNILFLGKISRDVMQKYYCVADYIIRAENIACIGRTVWEGLYSGTGLIIQGKTDEIYKDPIGKDAEKKGRIYNYKIRNQLDFINVLKRIDGKKIGKKIGYTNADVYAKEFSRFIMEA